MVNQAVVEWLRRYLNAGYDLGTLRKTLLHHGYNEKDIDDAVRVIYGPAEIRHVLHLSKTSVVVVAAVVFTFLIVVGGLFYFLTPKTPSQLLDVRTELISPSVKVGERLEFNLELTSLGAAKRYDVDVRYEIEKDGKKITFKEETVGLETSRSYKTFIDIAADVQPGDYILKTTARYNGKIARATSSFRVYKESIAATCYDGIQNQDEEGIDCGGYCEPCASCFDGIQNQGETGVDCGGPCKSCEVEPTECSDNNPCTEDELIDGECRFTPIEPCCGNGKCEEGESGACLADCPSDDPFAGMNVWQKLEAIEELAKDDDNKAIGYCNNFDNNLHKDKCFDNVAKASNKDNYCDNIEDERTREECYIAIAKSIENYEICSKIQKETRRDRCYMHFATAGIDYSICDKVSDYYLKQLCNSMKSLQENPQAPES